MGWGLPQVESFRDGSDKKDKKGRQWCMTGQIPFIEKRYAPGPCEDMEKAWNEKWMKSPEQRKINTDRDNTATALRPRKKRIRYKGKRGTETDIKGRGCEDRREWDGKKGSNVGEQKP